jgi:hypothetical protein
MVHIDDNNSSSGFEMVMALDNAKVMFQFDNITERAAALYQKIFDLIEADDPNNKSEVSHSLKLENSNRSSQMEANEQHNGKHIISNYESNFDIIVHHQQQQNDRSEGNKVYERKLPPNVEEMLRQKRQQLANQLSYQ